MLAPPTQTPSTPAPPRPQRGAPGDDAGRPADGFAILLAGLIPPPATTAGAPVPTEARADIDADPKVAGASAPPSPTAPAPTPAPRATAPLPTGAPVGFAAAAAEAPQTTTPAAATGVPGDAAERLPANGEGLPAQAVPMHGTAQQPLPASALDPANRASPGFEPVPAVATPVIASPAVSPPGIVPAIVPPAVVTPASLTPASPAPASSATVLVDALSRQPAADPTAKPSVPGTTRLQDRAGSANPLLPRTIDPALADPLAAPPPESAADVHGPVGAPGAKSGAPAAARPGSDTSVAAAPHPSAMPEPQAPAPTDPPVEPATGLAALTPVRSEPVSSAPAGAPHPAATSAPPGQPAVQIAVQIAAAVPRRIERLFVQLEPPALGRVEVRLEFSRDNRVSALIAAERHDTLDVLQRDSRGLERALQHAGLRLGENGLSFSLRQEQRQERRGTGAFSAPLRTEPAAAARPPEPPQPLRWVGVHRVLDIRI